MPWRETSDPYRILISEIMLQQTQVCRVRTKYTEFLKNFPTVRALAKAPLGEVLRAWSGLGYNRRAKYLHLCAKKIVTEHGGKFPRTYEELIALPGIGVSTGGALLAFSFGKETAMIDTNIRRILVRCFFNKKIPSDKELFMFAQKIIPKGKGRMWNYAMLDLGATQCTARNHKESCPLMSFHGKVGDFVYKKPQKKFEGSRRFYRGRILFELARRQLLLLPALSAALDLPPKKVNPIVADLLKEGMIVKCKAGIALPK